MQNVEFLKEVRYSKCDSKVSEKKLLQQDLKARKEKLVLRFLTTFVNLISRVIIAHHESVVVDGIIILTFVYGRRFLFETKKMRKCCLLT